MSDSKYLLGWEHLDYLRYAYRVARIYSNDPSTQNGAILVEERLGNNVPGQVVLEAANSFPSGVYGNNNRWERPLKYFYIEHAERNLIYRMVRHGISPVGKIMYCCWASCADCARAIIQSGIKTVVAHEHEYQLKQTHWLEQIKIADEMLHEAGVVLYRLPGKIGGVKIRFGGEIIEP